MQREDLPLFAWTPPVRMIPFPATARTGHALRIARQIAKGRTDNEASWALERACDSFVNQMVKAGFSEIETQRQLRDFRRAIHDQCRAIQSPWVPVIEDSSPHHRTPGGAA